MPQISQLAATWASQLFWLAVTFGIVFFVVGRGMLPKVQKTIDARDKTVADDLAAATAARDAADQAEEAWRVRENANREKAQALVAEARQNAARATEATLAEANAVQAADLAQREASIRDASARAMGEIEAVAAEAARDIVARVSSVSVGEEESLAAVRTALARQRTGAAHG